MFVPSQWVRAVLCCAVLATSGLSSRVHAGESNEAGAAQHRVEALKITVLVTNLAGDQRAGSGEWGYAALVEADGRKILYDTGASAGMALANAQALHLELSDVQEVVLSHNHNDHVGGLMSLRNELKNRNEGAVGRAHVGSHIFEPRWGADGTDHNGVNAIKAQYLASGGRFIEHDKPAELFPGVWFTGPVPRPNPERNWFPGLTVDSGHGRIEDTVAEDSALLLDTPRGVVILTGCGHAGIVNIAQYAHTLFPHKPILAIIGGLHLFSASDATLAWTGAQLRTLQVESLLAGHCTGIEATYRLRDALGLNRKSAVVSAVGSSYTLSGGIDARQLAQ